MIEFLTNLNWTAIIIAIAVCSAAPRCLTLTLQICRVIWDIFMEHTQVERIRRSDKWEV